MAGSNGILKVPEDILLIKAELVTSEFYVARASRRDDREVLPHGVEIDDETVALALRSNLSSARDSVTRRAGVPLDRKARR